MFRAAEKKPCGFSKMEVQEGIMNEMKSVQSLGMFVKASVTATARALRKCTGGSLVSEDRTRIEKKDLP